MSAKGVMTAGMLLLDYGIIPRDMNKKKTKLLKRRSKPRVLALPIKKLLIAALILLSGYLLIHYYLFTPSSPTQQVSQYPEMSKRSLSDFDDLPSTEPELIEHNSSALGLRFQAPTNICGEFKYPYYNRKRKKLYIVPGEPCNYYLEALLVDLETPYDPTEFWKSYELFSTSPSINKKHLMTKEVSGKRFDYIEYTYPADFSDSGYDFQRAIFIPKKRPAGPGCNV